MDGGGLQFGGGHLMLVVECVNAFLTQWLEGD